MSLHDGAPAVDARPYRVLVVCTGNICRSPMGEVVLGERLAEAGLDGVVDIDSAGVSSEEAGNPIDRRARAALAERGYPVPHRQARRVTDADLREVDLLLAMTQAHASALLRRGAAPERVRLYRSFEDGADGAAHVEATSSIHGWGGPLDVPDPWYGGRRDFEECLDTVEAVAPVIVAHIRAALRR